MNLWRRNLIVCWFGVFAGGIGISQIAPVMPLYIRHLGISDTGLITRYSGLAFGVTYVVSAFFSPVWGMVADKYGRKPMLLRASLGLAIVIGCMGFAKNVYVLIGLRLLQGVISGFGTISTTFIATQTDKEHAGWALGILSTSNIAGSLLGPVIGGLIAEKFGLQQVFFITGLLMFIAFATTALFVKESFQPQEKKTLGIKGIWSQLPNPDLTLIIFATTFVMALALYSVEPIVTVYVTLLTRDTGHLALLSGLTFSVSGLASIIAAPRLGKLSDRIGAQKILVPALLVAGAIYIPQAFVSDLWQLIALRFLLGLAIAGLNPALNTLVRKTTPDFFAGKIFGLNISAQYLGIFAGSVLGGQAASYWGIRNLFFAAGILLLLNGMWLYLKGNALFRK